MELNLDDIANGKQPPQFKSDGERKIANFLAENSIKYKYEPSAMDVISIYPWMFKENWRGYIMQELERNMLRCYRN